MDRTGLVALVLSGAIAFGAVIGLAGVDLEEAAPLVPPCPRWSRPPPPEVYPLESTGALHYIHG